MLYCLHPYLVDVFALKGCCYSRYIVFANTEWLALLPDKKHGYQIAHCYYAFQILFERYWYKTEAMTIVIFVGQYRKKPDLDVQQHQSP